MHMQVDHAEPKTKIPAKRVKWVFEGPQVPSYEDTNIVVIKASPGASHHYPWLYFFEFNIFILRMIVQ
jgi:hypothetical protein